MQKIMDQEKLFKEVKQILYQNLERGYSSAYQTEFTYIKPSENFYLFQFFWDSCFHVFILTALGETELAKDCLRSLFVMQEENGFVGHIHYWNNTLPSRLTDVFQSRPSLGLDLVRSHMSALIQPPLVADALKRIWETSGDKDYLREMLPKLKKFYNWLAENRDFDGDGLITIITPFESGMDWKATYDPVLNFPRKQADFRLFFKVIAVDFRNFLYDYDMEKVKKRDKFRVKDAGFNTIYVINLHALAELCEVLDDGDAKMYRERAERTLQGMLNIMYDEADAAFYDVSGKNDEKLRILTPTALFPVVVKELPQDLEKRVMDRHFFNEAEFHTKYPVPSLVINDPAFHSGKSFFIWRGPTWIVNNWFIHKFLLEKKYFHEAQHLIDSIKTLIEKSGFREYYNPFTGEGYGVKNFTWAGLVVDMIRSEKKHLHGG
jgi:glycogen debranching enzyme